MKFKEFVSWCNERACDGCWGMTTAMTCADITVRVNTIPFWKREKYWKDNYKDIVVREIVNPINSMIKQIAERQE